MNPNQLKIKDKDDFCKQMGLGLKMLIQQESKKNITKASSKEKKPTKPKGSLVKKGISKPRLKDEKMKRRERRRSNIEQRQRDMDAGFKLSRKFRDDSHEKRPPDQEPLNRRIQRLIESVSGSDATALAQKDRIRELEDAQIITPKVLPGVSQKSENKIMDIKAMGDGESKEGGILETLLKDSPEDFLSMFEDIQEQRGEGKFAGNLSEEEGRKQVEKVQGLEVVPEDDENMEAEAADLEKDQFLTIEQKMTAKLDLKLRKMREQKNTYEYKMERLKREGRQYIFRRQIERKLNEPILGNKKGSPNPRNRAKILPKSPRNEEENPRVGLGRRGRRRGTSTRPSGQLEPRAEQRDHEPASGEHSGRRI